MNEEDRSGEAAALRGIERVVGRRVRRSRRSKMLGGVCGGIGEATGFSANTLRLCFAFAAGFATPVGIGVYVLLWMILPSE